MKKIMVIVLASAMGTYGYAQSDNSNTVKANPHIIKKSKNKRPPPLPPLPPAPPVIFEEELLPIPPPPPPAPPVPIIMEENEIFAPPPPLSPPPPTRFKKGSKKLMR